jgi:protein involved in polysaccharide export with SLBB domain
LAPGFVPYLEGRRVGDYVNAAGGYSSRANRGRARVTLAATGRQIAASEAGTLRPGDVIWVPAKEEKSTWSSVREFLTAAAQIATLYLVAREATR